MTVETGLCACGCGRQPKTGSPFMRGHHFRQPGWQSARHQASHGYFVVNVQRDDPLAAMAIKAKRGNLYALEHRIVMARYLGRPLHAWETVHHIDGDRSNNAIENLQLRIGRHGAGQALRCADCGSTNLLPDELAEPVDREEVRPEDVRRSP